MLSPSPLSALVAHAALTMTHGDGKDRAGKEKNKNEIWPVIVPSLSKDAIRSPKTAGILALTRSSPEELATTLASNTTDRAAIMAAAKINPGLKIATRSGPDQIKAIGMLTRQLQRADQQVAETVENAAGRTNQGGGHEVAA
jgi:hypothetical protein